MTDSEFERERNEHIAKVWNAVKPGSATVGDSFTAGWNACLRSVARRLRKKADAEWELNRKESSTTLHGEAAQLEKEAER